MGSDSDDYPDAALPFTVSVTSAAVLRMMWVEERQKRGELMNIRKCFAPWMYKGRMMEHPHPISHDMPESAIESFKNSEAYKTTITYADEMNTLLGNTHIKGADQIDCFLDEQLDD